MANKMKSSSEIREISPFATIVIALTHNGTFPLTSSGKRPMSTQKNTAISFPLAVNLRIEVSRELQ